MANIVETYKFRDFINLMDDITPTDNESRKYEPSSSFCNETWEGAKRLARYGIKNQKSIERIITSMALLEQVKTKSYSMKEHGLCVDIGTYLQGDPECWIAEDFTFKSKRVVKILISIGCAWTYSVSQIENRGAGIISLIQMLKKQGYIVKINLYSSVNYEDKEYTCFIKIPSNPLDLQSLSYALCSPTLLRRFMFAWLESKTNKSHCGGYGIAITVNEVAISKDIIHFQGLNSEECDYETEEETKKYILKIFDKFIELNTNSKVGRYVKKY